MITEITKSRDTTKLPEPPKKFSVMAYSRNKVPCEHIVKSCLSYAIRNKDDQWLESRYLEIKAEKKSIVYTGTKDICDTVAQLGNMTAATALAFGCGSACDLKFAIV
jgi:hypothetical protein